MFAFVGRYAHQSMHDMLKMPLSDLTLLANAVAEILEEENEANRRSTDGV